MVLTLVSVKKSVSGFLKEYGVELQKDVQDPLVVLTDGIKHVDEQRVGRIVEILSYADEFALLVNNRLSEPHVEERHTRMVEDLTKNILEVKDTYQNHMKDGLDGAVARFMDDIEVRFKGTASQRFDTAWKGLQMTLTGTVKSIKAGKEILAAYSDYHSLKGEAELIAWDLHNDFRDDQLITAEAEANTAQTEFEAYQATGPQPGDSEFLRLRETRDEALKSYAKARDTYELLHLVATEIGNSRVLGRALADKLTDIVKAEERVKEKTAVLLSTNRDAYAMLKATYASQLSLSRAGRAVDAATEGVNAAINAVADLSDDILRTTTRSAYRPTVDSKTVERLFTSTTAYRDFLTTAIPELRNMRQANYEENQRLENEAASNQRDSFIKYNTTMDKVKKVEDMRAMPLLAPPKVQVEVPIQR